LGWLLVNNKKTYMSDSAYKVLLDERDVRAPDAQSLRRQKTRNLLSGGFAKQSLADQLAPPNGFQNFQPPVFNQPFNPIPSFNQQFNPIPSFMNAPGSNQYSPPSAPSFNHQFAAPTQAFSPPAFQSLSNPYQRPSSSFARPGLGSGLSSFLQNNTQQPKWRPRSRTASFSRSSRQYKARPRGRYDLSDDDFEDEEELTPAQKKKVVRLIEEMCPASMTNAIEQNVLEQMDRLDKQGYRLPKNYDKTKHDLSANELQLFGQQSAKNKDKDRVKAESYISLSAKAVKWACKFFHIDIIDTATLPDDIRDSLDNGEFDDVLDDVGQYMRGSMLDHPIVVAGSRFLDKLESSKTQETPALDPGDRKGPRKTSVSSLNECFGMPLPVRKSRIEEVVEEPAEQKRQPEAKRRPVEEPKPEPKRRPVAEPKQSEAKRRPVAEHKEDVIPEKKKA
jgi:hypothetical protein